MRQVMKCAPRVGPPASGPSRPTGTGTGTGTGTEDLLIALQILPGFFSNCLFLALYDSVLLLKRAVSLLRADGDGEWQRALTSEGLRAIWRGFLLDAHKQVGYHGSSWSVTSTRVKLVG